MGTLRPLGLVVILVAGFFPPPIVRALGVREGADPPTASPGTVKGEWVLAMTAFDASALNLSKRTLADTLVRRLQTALIRIERRRRDDDELAAYGTIALHESRSAAGKALAAKRAERDALLYKGYPQWKYLRELRKLEMEVSALKERLVQVSENPEPIEPSPSFSLTEENRRGIFPPAPPAGQEDAFSRDKKVDGILLGSVEERFGRVFVHLRVYGAVARSIIFEDIIPFSPEGLDQGMSEAAERLFAALAGEQPSRLTVAAEPEQTVISVAGAYGGRGSVGPILLGPGSVLVEAYAQGYHRWSEYVDLGEGEQILVSLRLAPLARQALTVNSLDGIATVHQEGRYIGVTPLTLDLYGDTHISLRNDSGATAAVVVRTVKGDAVNGDAGALALSLRPPDPEGYAPVEAARREFYGAYGRFWIALPLAFLLNGISRTYIDAHWYRGNPELVDDAYRYYFLYLGSSILAGAFLVESIYRLVRYLDTSQERSTQVKDGR